MKAKKTIAVVLALTFILTFTLSALAEGTQAPGNSLDQRIQNLQNAKTLRDKLEALKAEILAIKDLHLESVELRKQLNNLQKDQLRPAMQQARRVKNYDAMINSLNNLKLVQGDLQNIKQLTAQNVSIWDEMRSLRQSKNFDGAMAALKQIEGNIQAKVDAYNKAVNDMNKAISDLKTPAQP